MRLLLQHDAGALGDTQGGADTELERRRWDDLAAKR